MQLMHLCAHLFCHRFDSLSNCARPQTFVRLFLPSPKYQQIKHILIPQKRRKFKIKAVITVNWVLLYMSKENYTVNCIF